MTASIKPLQEAVRSSLRSGIFLFDFTRVVEELVFNSLDARATKVSLERELKSALASRIRGIPIELCSFLQVSVFVGVGRCYLKVVDDGTFLLVFIYRNERLFIFLVHNSELLGTFRFRCIFMVSINVFVGSGITRDGLELVGERYGMHFFVFFFFFFICLHAP